MARVAFPGLGEVGVVLALLGRLLVAGRLLPGAISGLPISGLLLPGPLWEGRRFSFGDELPAVSSACSFEGEGAVLEAPVVVGDVAVGSDALGLGFEEGQVETMGVAHDPLEEGFGAEEGASCVGHGIVDSIGEGRSRSGPAGGDAVVEAAPLVPVRREEVILSQGEDLGDVDGVDELEVRAHVEHRGVMRDLVRALLSPTARGLRGRVTADAP